MPITRCDCAGYRLLLGLVLLLTTWFMLTPAPMPLPDAPLADKWAHLAAFALLAFLVDASWPEHPFNRPKWAWLLAYGLAIELLQSQIPNRLFSLGDVAANALGIALYAFGLSLLLRRLGLR